MKKYIWVYLATALLFTFFLGCIDEGYNDLTTFTKFWNYPILAVYALIFWGAQSGIHWLFQKLFGFQSSFQLIVSVLLGLLIPLFAVMMIW